MQSLSHLQSCKDSFMGNFRHSWGKCRVRFKMFPASKTTDPIDMNLQALGFNWDILIAQFESNSKHWRISKFVSLLGHICCQLWFILPKRKNLPIKTISKIISILSTSQSVLPKLITRLENIWNCWSQYSWAGVWPLGCYHSGCYVTSEIFGLNPSSTPGFGYLLMCILRSSKWWLNYCVLTTIWVFWIELLFPVQRNNPSQHRHLGTYQQIENFFFSFSLALALFLSLPSFLSNMKHILKRDV